MSPEKQERLQACLDEAAAISYADSDSEILTSLEAIEAQCAARYSLTSALTWQFLYLPKHRHEPWNPPKAAQLYRTVPSHPSSSRTTPPSTARRK